MPVKAARHVFVPQPRESLMNEFVILSAEGVSGVVLGCQTPEQVEQNCRLIDGAVTLSFEQMDRLREAFSGIDPRVINPGVWFNHT